MDMKFDIAYLLKYPSFVSTRCVVWSKLDGNWSSLCACNLNHLFMLTGFYTLRRALMLIDLCLILYWIHWSALIMYVGGKKIIALSLKQTIFNKL